MWSSPCSSLGLVSSFLHSFPLQILHWSCLADKVMNRLLALLNWAAVIFHPCAGCLLLYVVPSFWQLQRHCLSWKALDTELNYVLQSEEGSADAFTLLWVALGTLFLGEEHIWLVAAVLIWTEPTQALVLKSHFCPSNTNQTQTGMLAGPSWLREG